MRLKVVTYNLRYGTAPDGPNAWEHRRDAVAALVRRHAPDVLGLQEALPQQVEWLLAHAPGLMAVGCGREDGQNEGESCTIMVRAERFRVAEAGTFWLAPEPSRPGALGWGAKHPRICTWAKLVAFDGATFCVANVHLDHESTAARREGCRLLASRLGGWGGPLVLMGDFNTGWRDKALEPLTLQWRRVPMSPEVGTYNAFVPETPSDEAIDHVWVSAGWEVHGAAADVSTFEGRCPSDHYPVIADLEWARP